MFELPKLPYSYDGLEPHISAVTIETHYTKHHQHYLDSLNKALEKHKYLYKKSIEEIIRDAEDMPDDIYWDIRKFGGGYYNHNLYFLMLGKSKNSTPVGDVGKKISETFESFEEFKKLFTSAALGVFGSGYAWLVEDKNKNFRITKTKNQDCPLSYGQIPVLCIDVWEHAYYLDRKNKRAEYIENWWNVVNWESVEELYQKNKTTIKL